MGGVPDDGDLEVELPEHLFEMPSLDPQEIIRGYYDRLNTRQREFLQARIDTKSDLAACSSVGISRGTFRNWMASKPEFRYCYDVVRQQPSGLLALEQTKALLDGLDLATESIKDYFDSDFDEKDEADIARDKAKLGMEYIKLMSHLSKPKAKAPRKANDPEDGPMPSKPGLSHVQILTQEKMKGTRP